MSNNESLQGRSAIVTGSGRGIGAATALELAGRGAKVVLNYLNDADAAEGVRRRIADAGGTAIVVPADAATEEGTRALADAAIAEFGGIDILVSNAGPLFRGVPLTQLTWAEFGGNVERDLKCAFLTTQAVLPAMLDAGYGRIVYIGSTSGRHPSPGLAHHGAARAAIHAFAGYVAVETGRHGITANVVAPGMVATDRTAALDQVTAHLATLTPVGRIATPDDVARAVAFFAADTAGFYTDTYFPVDGGLHR